MRIGHGLSRVMFNDFITGMGMCFDIGGTLARAQIEDILSRSDGEAIYSDWKAVGDAMRSAMRQVDEVDNADT